jgi:3-oxoacyl-[acyl-carrier-protein] synthase II
MRRVAITGMGLLSPIGNSLAAAARSLELGKHGIVRMPEWERVQELNSRVAGVIAGPLPELPRKRVRTMGRVAQLALLATDQAIADAGLDQATLTDERTGLMYGSTHGSTSATEEFCRKLLLNDSLLGVPGSAYLKFMSHTCAANLAEAYGIRGRVVPIVSACASATQSIGAAYEAIKFGQQDVMLCGGAEENHFVHAAVFDLVYAASQGFNDAPELTPKPFDVARDGLVVAEGAGTLVLEDWERAERRGARIHAELVGYGACCDGTHVTSPSPDGMARAMVLALKDAELGPEAIGYINGHATGTVVGDIAESHAVAKVFANRTPLSSTKGNTGHTLGACGAIEAAFCVWMLNNRVMLPTRNLVRVDERCAKLDYVMREPRELRAEHVMSNNFAFGGINASLVLRRVSS